MNLCRYVKNSDGVITPRTVYKTIIDAITTLILLVFASIIIVCVGFVVIDLMGLMVHWIFAVPTGFITCFIVLLILALFSEYPMLETGSGLAFIFTLLSGVIFPPTSLFTLSGNFLIGIGISLCLIAMSAYLNTTDILDYPMYICERRSKDDPDESSTDD